MMEQFIMGQLLVLNNTYISNLRHLGNAAVSCKYLGLGETGMLLFTEVWNFWYLHN